MVKTKHGHDSEVSAWRSFCRGDENRILNPIENLYERGKMKNQLGIRLTEAPQFNFLVQIFKFFRKTDAIFNGVIRVQ